MFRAMSQYLFLARVLNDTHRTENITPPGSTKAKQHERGYMEQLVHGLEPRLNLSIHCTYKQSPRLPIWKI
ncbi:hypothetical protein E4U35_008362 [Claviceps purpurea]|nr:hypothetical protein E4U35_008362 [Claviceps purpurea]KAG6218396.1 hypothetical protein E4U34_004134 [Claviceps purpurea]KAG6262282.1 hypothetical protein E4U49_003210 [Claviceps purpurea]KAG6283504.1 hypothetical protein E4U46_007749 [Claviceps purpurea]KAG6311465.1 hypothetical protein E4U44_004284 [Claviceps purpurea]